MLSKAKYGVRFIGYSAEILVRKKNGDVQYAEFDFISEYASIHTDGGVVFAQHLARFVKDLPNIVGELHELQKELASSPRGEACRGPYSAIRAKSSGWIKIRIASEAETRTILIRENVELRDFIRKVAKRFAAVEQIIEQTRMIGGLIQRRPYDAYLQELADTGLARVEYHGYALLINGKLRFFPERRTALVRHQHDKTYVIQPLDGGASSLN